MTNCIGIVLKEFRIVTSDKTMGGGGQQGWPKFVRGPPYTLSALRGYTVQNGSLIVGLWTAENP